jgi:hypothetical protein
MHMQTWCAELATKHRGSIQTWIPPTGQRARNRDATNLVEPPEYSRGAGISHRAANAHSPFYRIIFLPRHRIPLAAGS